MKKAVLLVGVVVIVSAGVALGAYWRWSIGREEAISFNATHDLGDVVQGEQLEHVFSVHNDKPSDLTVEKVVVSYASAVVSIDSVFWQKEGG